MPNDGAREPRGSPGQTEAAAISDRGTVPSSSTKGGFGGLGLALVAPAVPVPRPLVLLPTLNEEAGLAATLEELRTVRGFPGGRFPDVLVLDGNSTDGTREVAERLRADVLLQRGTGKGGAIRQGLDAALSRGYTSIGVLDADGTYPCDRLPALFDLLETDADLVAGIRRPKDVSTATARDMVHRVGNGLLNLCAAQLSHGPILDVCSGFWGLRAEVVPSLNLESNGFEVESELFVKSVRQGLRIVQIPIEYRTRIGEAKLHAVRDGARILRSIVRHSFAPTPATSLPANRASLRTPRRAAARHPPLVRDLTTVLCAFEASSIVVVSGSARRAEANQVARAVEQYRPGVRVSTRIANGPFAPAVVDPTGTRVGPGAEGGSLLVTLPDGGDGGIPPGAALVSVPTLRRTLLVQRREPRLAGSSAGPSRSLPGRSAVRAPGPMRILGATLDPTGAQRELALLAANGAAAPHGLFEIEPSFGWSSTSTDPGGLSFQSTPGSLRFLGSR
jgi:dolichol-phosphate hexosyltransferase